MKEKYANLLASLCLLALDLIYLHTAFTAKQGKFSRVGAYSFPKILGIALAVLCILIIARTLFDRSGKAFRIENLPLLFLTAGDLALFFVLWQRLHRFWLWAFLFPLSLFFLYHTEGGRFSKKNIAGNVSLAAGTAAAAYLLFHVVMKASL